MIYLIKIAEAATNPQATEAGKLLKQITAYVVNPIITLFFVMALSVFAFGIFEFIRKSDNEEAKRKGQKHMMAGILGLFIMTVVFSIIHVLVNFVGEFGTKPDLWIIK